jgi:hypothetical protein
LQLLVLWKVTRIFQIINHEQPQQLLRLQIILHFQKEKHRTAVIQKSSIQQIVSNIIAKTIGFSKLSAKASPKNWIQQIVSKNISGKSIQQIVSKKILHSANIQ